MEESQKNCMSKVRNFAELAPDIGFSEFDLYDLYRSTFEKSELGRIKKLLPLREMAENFGLVSKSMRPNLLPQNFDKSLLKLENASEKYGESLKG